MLRKRMAALRGDDCGPFEWQLQVQLMRWFDAEQRLQVQLQSAKKELEALRPPAAAAEQLKRDLEAAEAQRRKMQVGHGSGDTTC